MAIFIKLFRLASWELVFGAVCGVAFGVLLAVWYRVNRQRKDERRQLVGRAAPHHCRGTSPLQRAATLRGGDGAQSGACAALRLAKPHPLLAVRRQGRKHKGGTWPVELHSFLHKLPVAPPCPCPGRSWA